MLRAVLHPVTDVVWVKTHCRASAAIVAWATEACTVFFVLLAGAVVDIVTKYEDWQAIPVPWTLEMSIWTQLL